MHLFMLLFSVFLSLISLQSSITVAEGLGTIWLTFVFIAKVDVCEGLGTIGMRFVFMAKVVFRLFLTTMVLLKLGMK